MSFGLIILDFDGTFTRVDDEAAPFLEGYLESLEALLGEPVAAEWERARSAILADPDQYGWEFEDKIVAPSHSDPYIQATATAQLLLASRPGYETAEARSAVLRQLFADNYAKAGTVFRHDAKAVVEQVLSTGVPVVVVTNSFTDAVQKKIDALDPDGKERLAVYGDAKKYVLRPPSSPDPRYDAVPQSVEIDGLSRPVYLARGHYFEVLDGIWKKTGTGPAETIVCGDIFELDLALPAALGARIHLVARPTTPAYERAAVEARGGTYSEHLAGLLDQLPS